MDAFLERIIKSISRYDLLNNLLPGIIYVELTEVGKLKIGLKYLTFVGEDGSIEYVYFIEIKYIEINVNE